MATAPYAIGGWFDGPLLAFDLETTGVDPHADVPVSYAVVRSHRGQIVANEASLVDPGRPIPAGATAVHGITTDRARHEGIELASAVRQLAERIIEASRFGVPIVGMNVGFDLTMLDTCYRHGMGRHLADDGFDGPVLDILVLDRHFDRYRRGRRTLSDLCLVYGVSMAKAHDASADASATLAILAEMCRRFPVLGRTRLADLHRLQRVWHAQWARSFSEWRRRNGVAEVPDLRQTWPISSAWVIGRTPRRSGGRRAGGSGRGPTEPPGTGVRTRGWRTPRGREDGRVRAWQVIAPGPIDNGPLRMSDLPDPVPGAGQVRISVRVCGVCRTDLHVAEGDLPVHRSHVVPGHQVVGTVSELGSGTSRFALGDRVGIAWLASTCGRCRFCRRGDENLCLRASFTGWDHDGGYAEYAVVDEAYAYRLPDELGDEQAAPLLCAGIIGYRALKLARLPPAGRLGIYGFGASAHITAQIAVAQGAALYVATRNASGQTLARELGAVWVGGATDPPPVRLDAAILFAPAGELVPPALAALDRGGVLAIAGIHLSNIPPLVYTEHLFEERVLRSVTANTRRDGEELLGLASRLGVRATTQPYSWQNADRALSDLAHDRVTGAAVLQVS